MTTPHYGQPVHPVQAGAQPQYEIGLDGKPYEVYPVAPPQPHAATIVQPAHPQHAAAQQVPYAVPQATYAPSQATHYQGAYGPNSASLRGRVETEVLSQKRVSMEHNHFAWTALGLGALALILQAIHLGFTQGTLGVIALPTIVATAYFGVRGHNAAVNGFATNARVAHAGLVLAVLALLAYALVPFAYATMSARLD